MRAWQLVSRKLTCVMCTFDSGGVRCRQRATGGVSLRTIDLKARMQRPSRPQRDAAHRRTDFLTRAENVEAPETPKADPDAGIAAEAGSAETALLQPEGQPGDSGGGPRGDPLISQLYVFGRSVCTILYISASTLLYEMCCGGFSKQVAADFDSICQH